MAFVKAFYFTNFIKISKILSELIYKNKNKLWIRKKY